MDLTELNDAQRGAVTAGDGVHLLIAGAGTGKTRTLVHRVAWLVAQGVPASQIVLLTFTRRAAREMLDRAAKLVGDDVHLVQGGTFHAYALTHLRRHAHRFGHPAGFTLLDAADAESLFGLVRGDVVGATAGRRFPKRGTLHDVHSRAINLGLTIREVLARDYPQYLQDADVIAQISARYEARKQALHAFDYDDLLTKFAELLRSDVGPDIARGVRHVLVDEYQDTNRVQAEIALRLHIAHGNMMVVGDEAQSIYAFRGATVRNILDLPKMLPATTVHLLEENYRSTTPVLQLANGVLASASEGYGKVLRGPRGPGPQPELVEVLDEHEQADHVVGQVLAWREEGLNLSQIAVLFRSATHAHLLEAVLGASGIPYRKVGGLRFSEAAHVKDALALLRVVATPTDALSWFRLVSQAEGLGPKGSSTLAERIVDAGGLDPAWYRGKRSFEDLVSLKFAVDAISAVQDDVCAAVDAAVAWTKERLPRTYDDAKKRARDLDSLPLLAERHASLASLLDELALDPPQVADAVEDDADDEVLTLSTIHSAKGLEWEAVALLQLADGAFPSATALEDDEALEEERRLLYVAVTRARRGLAMVAPRFVHGWGGRAFGPGCALLDGIDDLRARVRRVRGGPQAFDTQQDAPGAAFDEGAAAVRAAAIGVWFSGGSGRGGGG
jgi:DNA helicase-2/ATP-dependent DNA helicase PcrA